MDRVTRVLYISGKRAKERVLLQRSSKIEFEEIQFKKGQLWPLDFLVKMGRVAKQVRKDETDAILLEAPTLFGLVAILFKHRDRSPISVRLKGDIWNEFEEAGLGIPLVKRIKKTLNYLSGKTILERADRILPISIALEERVRANARNRVETVVVGNYFERETARRDQPAASTAAALVPRSRYFLTITNFQFWKKTEMLLQYAPLLLPILEEHDLRWVVLGEGLFREEIERGLPAHGGRIELRGFQPVEPFFTDRTVAMLHVSGADGIPNVILEAYARGIPVIMNEECPAREIVVDDTTGYIVGQGNAAGVVRGLLADDEKRRELGDRARRHAEANHSVEIVSQKLMKVLCGEGV